MRPKRKANFASQMWLEPWSDCGLLAFRAPSALRDITSTSSRKTGRKADISWTANPADLRADSISAAVGSEMPRTPNSELRASLSPLLEQGQIALAPAG